MRSATLAGRFRFARSEQPQVNIARLFRREPFCPTRKMYGKHLATRLCGGSTSMARYSKKASEKVEKAMHEKKRGTLKSGRSGKKVKSRKQAIAIGLSQARRAGAKVPRKKSSSKKK